MTDNTTITQKAARRKLNLGERFGKRQRGVQTPRASNSTRSAQTFGSQSLLDRVHGPRNPHPSRATEEHEKAVMDYCLEYSTTAPLG